MPPSPAPIVRRPKSAISGHSINVCHLRNPLVVAWSAILPGLGHLYCVAIIEAVFLMIVGGVIIYYSHLLPAIGYTAIGSLAQAKEVFDPQWMLNLPSFYCFSIYDSYVKAVELNKIFDQEQAQYFKNQYQSPLFIMPGSNNNGGI